MKFVIDISEYDKEWIGNIYGIPQDINTKIAEAIINAKPCQPEPHEIGYDDCANALLKMWMDNVLTDGEYYRIADKLNKKWGKTEVTT